MKNYYLIFVVFVPKKIEQIITKQNTTAPTFSEHVVIILGLLSVFSEPLTTPQLLKTL